MGFLFTSPEFLAFVVFLVGAVGIASPSFLKGEGCSSVLHFGVLFSAGVLLAGGLVHLLPDAQESFRGSTFPWASFICGLGFLLILAIDAAVGAVTAAVEEEELPSSASDDDVENPKCTQSTALLERDCSKRRYIVLGEEEKTAVLIKSKFALGVVLLVALSVHSFLAGLGMGADQSHILSIFFAIVAHKGLAGFSLGAAFVKAHLDLWRFVLVGFIFSVSTPCGIAVGAAVAQSCEGPILGVLKALAAGTFLYVAVAELMVKELAEHKVKGSWLVAARVLVLVAGFVFMSVLAIWV